MAKNDTQKEFIISDLLSFLICKIKSVPKKKLLDIINDFYSEEAISEAQKVLFCSIPEKKSTRQGRRVKHPDPLVATYDCIQLIPQEDLPTFVCKDLNNVPKLKLDIRKLESPSSKDKGFIKHSTKNLDEHSDEDFEMDEVLCRKEQKIMKCQISEMFSIISELKDGLQRYMGNQEMGSKRVHLRSTLSSRNIYSSCTPNDKLIDDESKVNDEDLEKMDKMNHVNDSETSKLNGLALLQKLIDEDDESMDFDPYEKTYTSDESDEDLFMMDEYSQPETLRIPESTNLTQGLEENLNTQNSITVKTENPGLEDVTSENGARFISVRNNLTSEISPLNSDMANHVDVAAATDFINRIKEIEATVSDSSHRDQPLYGNEEARFPSAFKSESFNIDLLESSQKPQGSIYRCQYCMEIFSAYKRLRKHMNSEHISKHCLNCVLCNSKFLDRNTLRDHFASCLEKNNEKFKKNICNICKTYYASCTALKQHKNLHEQFRPHACPHCPFKYLNKATLDSHVRSQHSPLNKFVCPFCAHSAITNAYLKKHIKVHTGEAPFMCTKCGHRAKTKFLLKRHMELHGPLRERKCDKCSFVCIGLNQYLRHRRNAHGKPIVCHICKQSFKQSNTFIRHYNFHTQNKPYSCEHCLYTAKVKETLRRHKLTHTGSSVQMCPDCCVPLRNKRIMKRHQELYCNNLYKDMKDIMKVCKSE